ncbi:MAG: hypothetical protein HY340_02875 [Candidatus Kerfeldbacteria bacterium]|nr:hypothetical protein [Candidatus Kerfeldbacteria bacterium]
MATKNTNGLQLLRQLLESAEVSLAGAQKLLAELIGEPLPTPTAKPSRAKELPHPDDVDGKVIEGIFDGQNMIGNDGKTYSVPANYASKSKLVEGDTLKLTIAPDGSFIYKQIGPVDRKRAIGKLLRDETTDEFVVDVQGQRFKVLRASITYFKAEEGDEVVVLMPKNAESTWVAVENIIKAGTSAEDLLNDTLE